MIAAEPVVQIAVALGMAVKARALLAAFRACRIHVAAFGSRTNLVVVRQTPEHYVAAKPFVHAEWNASVAARGLLIRHKYLRLSTETLTTPSNSNLPRPHRALRL